MIVEELILRIRALVDPVVDNIPPKLEDIKKKAGSAGSALAAMGAALAALTVVSARAVRDQQRLADGLGESLQTVQELGYAFAVYGASQNDMADALATIADRAEDAKGGMQSFIDDFALIGVAVDDLRDKSPAELFELITQRASETTDANKRVTASVRLFEETLGRKLIPLLAQGSVELGRLKEQARDLGLIIDEETSEAATQLTSDLDVLRARAIGLARGLGLRLLPAGQSVTREMKRLLDVMQPLITRGFDGLADSVNMAATQLETPAGRIIAILGGALFGRSVFGAAMKAASAIPIVGAALSGLGATMASLALPAAILAGVVIALDDLNTAAEGGESTIGRLADAFGERDAVEGGLKGLKDMVYGAAEAFTTLGTAIDAALMTQIQPALDAMQPLIERFTRGLIRFSRATRAIGRFVVERGSENLQTAARGFELSNRFAAGDEGVELSQAGAFAVGGRDASGAQQPAFSISGAVTASSASARAGLTIAPSVSVSSVSDDQIARTAGRVVEQQVRVALAGAGADHVPSLLAAPA